jgi:hypothetical protein
MKQLKATLRKRALLEALILALVLTAVLIGAWYFSENAFWHRSTIDF